MRAKPQAPKVSKAATRRVRPADAVAASWVDQTPEAIQPYLRLMRLDRPIGIWLLYWPCVFGLALGASVQHVPIPNIKLLVLFFLGAVLMRGAGCTFNDIVDRKFDAKVKRTRGRPIPSGKVSVPAAWAFAGVLCILSLLILLTFNLFSIWLGLVSLVFIVAYPFMKRITWWPQAWLGLTFNWGALLGFAAETGHLSWPAYLLYAGCFFWTLGYDTIYAHQDKEDDILIGVKSSALKLGHATRYWLYMFYTIAFVLILLAGLMAGLGIPFALALLVAGLHLVWQVYTLDTERPLLCLKIFKSNRDTGALIAAACVFAVMVKF
jgi:4-hydroxybenzoate polyprenyltransferase